MDEDFFDSTVGTVPERWAAKLRVVGPIPAWNQYFYGPRVVIPGADVCECEFYEYHCIDKYIMYN